MTCKRKMGLVGTKLGMTKVFSEVDSSLIPVTVIDVSQNFVVQVKSPEKDGYAAVQIGFTLKSNRSRLKKPVLGHYAKHGVAPCASLKEFTIDASSAGDYKPGQQISADLFAAGQKVDVRGTSIGKGFAGVIKRHHFSSNRASHGNSISHRKPGSIGMAQDPGRVFPGKRMAGHMGCESVMAQNLVVVRVCTERNLLWLKGSVPGSKGARVVIIPAVKVAA